MLGKLLEPEMGDGDPGILGELLEDSPGNLTVAGILLTVSGNQKELELLLSAGRCRNTYGCGGSSRTSRLHYVVSLTYILRPLLCGPGQTDPRSSSPPQMPKPSWWPTQQVGSSYTLYISPSSVTVHA